MKKILLLAFATLSFCFANNNVDAQACGCVNVSCVDGVDAICGSIFDNTNGDTDFWVYSDLSGNPIFGPATCATAFGAGSAFGDPVGTFSSNDMHTFDVEAGGIYFFSTCFGGNINGYTAVVRGWRDAPFAGYPQLFSSFGTAAGDAFFGGGGGCAEAMWTSSFSGSIRVSFQVLPFCGPSLPATGFESSFIFASLSCTNNWCAVIPPANDDCANAMELCCDKPDKCFPSVSSKSSKSSSKSSKSSSKSSKSSSKTCKSSKSGCCAPNAAIGSNETAGGDIVPGCANEYGGSHSGAGVWYKTTAKKTAVYTVSTCGPNTNFDTHVTIFEGTCAGLVCVTANDDGPFCTVASGAGPLASEASWCAVKGTTYYILVGGSPATPFETTGTFDISITCCKDKLACASPKSSKSSKSSKGSKDLEAGSVNSADVSIAAYPNPISNVATLEFSLVKDGNATVRVVSLNGDVSEQMYTGFVPANTPQRVKFDSNNYASGIYFVEVTANDQIARERIVIIK